MLIVHAGGGSSNIQSMSLRYVDDDDPEFVDDIMGSSESYRIGDTHYRDYVNHFKKVSIGTTLPDYKVDYESGKLTEPTQEDLDHKLP